jgi:hypothetical protein
MSDLLSSAEKTEYINHLTDVFDTFKRKIVVYLEPQKAIISTNPNFSRFGNNSQNTSNIPLQPKKIEIYATIQHKEDQKYPYIYSGPNDPELKNKTAIGRCRIKVYMADANLFKDAKIFEIDGFSYDLDNTPRPRGLFTPNFYTFYLIRRE